MIQYDEKERIFKIDTPHTSYVMAVVDEAGYLGHAYYGRRLQDADVAYLMRTEEPPHVPSVNGRDKLSFLDCFPMEYPTHGIGDFREDALTVRTQGGHSATELHYAGYEIVDGKPALDGLPATFAGEAPGEEAQTLIITLRDDVIGLVAELYYSVFADNDAIVRSVRLRNEGAESLYLDKVYSASIDMDDIGYELLTLHGSWARERHISRTPLSYGFQGLSSARGESSHQHHPFLGILTRGADQERGEVIGMHLVYSGNFSGLVYKGQFDNVRSMLGIGGEEFCWKLEPGESFQAPEVALVYSSEGLGAMTRTYHDLYRRHLIRSAYKDRPRPILINNWEATYFDFDEQKLIDIAKEAAKSGIEMLVMDDGWFGNRCDDNRALGDWYVNEEKLKGGLKHLVDAVNALGMKFGIWFEPEMVSPDSDLYRAHPDWAIAVPGRKAGLCRNQYVLDLTREEVREYVFERLSAILDSANIEYVKWDMNRQLADLGSLALPADRQGELSHRYVLAVYELQERLVTRYPDLLLENCSGGGARFDPGMLYYSPQIWCSDDTDAIERLAIQEGTALLYPLSTMGAHVSDCPNHAVGRVTPFETRGYVALAGTFGYELDITRIPEKDRALIPQQVGMYHKYHGLVADGDYYRIASYRENHFYDSWMTVARDRGEALLWFIQVLGRPNHHSRNLRLQGLDPQKRYCLSCYDVKTGQEHPYAPSGRNDIAACTVGASVPVEAASYGGDMLMYAGIQIPTLWGDYNGLLLHLVAKR